MSDREEQINNLNDSIYRYSIEIRDLITQLRTIPNTIQKKKEKDAILKSIRLREDQIKKFERFLDILQKNEKVINKANKMSNATNRKNIPNSDISEDARRLGINIDEPQETEEEELERLMRENNIVPNLPPPPNAPPVPPNAPPVPPNAPPPPPNAPPAPPNAPPPPPNAPPPPPNAPPAPPNAPPNAPPAPPNAPPAPPNAPKNAIVGEGFVETIVRKREMGPSGPPRHNKTLCPSIFNTGNRVNEKYFIPSQFPNLTKIKAIPTGIKGGRKSRKNIKSKKVKKGRKSRKY